MKNRKVCYKFRIYNIFLGPINPVLNNSFWAFSIALKFIIYSYYSKYPQKSLKKDESTSNLFSKQS